MISSEDAGASSLRELRFSSRGAEVAALLREPSAKRPEGFPGVVLLPGATVTKEQEQGLAELLSGLGYATIALDQRNRGGVDVGGDLEMFINGQEPTEHKMVHDALAAAEVLRMQPEIDPDRIVYLGESNGGRFAIIASALDRRSRGVVAISTCGYDVEGEEIDLLRMSGPDAVRFLRSIDPDTYLERIPPRRLVMIHSKNDTVIPVDSASRTYQKALEPKAMHIVDCATHGRCGEMDPYIEEELARMVG
ncbi:alpha/beta hydrolase [Methanothrix harundinacea]|uniref:Hydrolase n=1 Tax=Methanothrix harundinacea (strain 6Ac) TaxID=1110509 RepID=G7WP15_METH6|nr:alpha/beta hydrolase [Methanothrix harundinacea]AET64856.1 Hydrolase [Methanothrix harundinacea 6Ac]